MALREPPSKRMPITLAKRKSTHMAFQRVSYNQENQLTARTSQEILHAVTTLGKATPSPHSIAKRNILAQYCQKTTFRKKKGAQKPVESSTPATTGSCKPASLIHAKNSPVIRLRFKPSNTNSPKSHNAQPLAPPKSKTNSSNPQQKELHPRRPSTPLHTTTPSHFSHQTHKKTDQAQAQAHEPS